MDGLLRHAGRQRGKGGVTINRKYASLLASLGFLAFLSMAQTDAALAATAPPLGNAQSFAVLGGSTVTNANSPGTKVYGDLGVWPGLAITGFPPGLVILPGTTHAGDAVAQGAQSDVTTAYNWLANSEGPCTTISADLGGQTLVPGVYCAASSMGLTGTLHLSGTSASDVWVFQIGTTLTTATDSSVVFDSLGQACNVFWQVGSSATLGTRTAFKGNILALASITMVTGATLDGRALARNGAVTLDTSTANATVCTPPGPPAAGVGLFKIFDPATIPAGGVSTLTITFTNTSGGLATLQAPFVDTLPPGMTTVGSPTTTCGGTPTVTPTSVGLPSGATIPSGTIANPGSCTLKVNVTVANDGSYANSVPAGALYTDVGRNPLGPDVILKVATAIPALSGWAMIMLASLLALAGFAAIRRFAI